MFFVCFVRATQCDHRKSSYRKSSGNSLTNATIDISSSSHPAMLQRVLENPPSERSTKKFTARPLGVTHRLSRSGRPRYDAISWAKAAILLWRWRCTIEQYSAAIEAAEAIAENLVCDDRGSRRRCATFAPRGLDQNGYGKNLPISHFLLTSQMHVCRIEQLGLFIKTICNFLSFLYALPAVWRAWPIYKPTWWVVGRGRVGSGGGVGKCALIPNSTWLQIIWKHVDMSLNEL